MHDEGRSERLTTTRMCENIACIANILKEDCRPLYRLTAERTGIPKTIVQQILRKDWHKSKHCVWFVPHTLTAKQKEQRLNHAYEFIETIKSDPNFLDSIIIADKSWCFAYNPETKCQSFELCGLNTPPSEKFWFQKSRVKMMLILFFDSKAVIRHKYAPESQTVNATFYIQVLDCLFASLLLMWSQKCGKVEVLSSPR